MAVRSDIWVDFDSSPRIIWVRTPATEIIIQDLVDTCRDIESELENLAFDALLKAAGKDQLGPTSYVGITATLLNAVVAFEARPGPTYTQCKVSGGNLVALDGVGTPISPIYPTSFTQVNYEASTSPTLVTSSTTGVGTPTQVADAVWNALLTTYPTLGTMGGALGTAASGSSPAQIADAVWDELKSAHLVAGSFGEWATYIKNQVDSIDSDTTGIIASQSTVISLIQTLLKYSKNRTRVDQTAKTLTIYDDDTLTPIKVFDLKDFTGAASITEVAERMPQP